MDTTCSVNGQRQTNGQTDWLTHWIMKCEPWGKRRQGRTIKKTSEIWIFFYIFVEDFCFVHSNRPTKCIYIYLYNNIFTALLLHVSVCYTPSSGRGKWLFTRSLSMMTGDMEYKTHYLQYFTMLCTVIATTYCNGCWLVTHLERCN